MIRTLFIIAGAAFVLTLGSAAGALAIGGRDMAAHGWNWTFHDRDGDALSIVRDDGVRPISTSRTLDWKGGAQLIVDLPYDVEYVQGDAASVVVTGPEERIALIRMDGDRLTADRPAGPSHDRIVFSRNRDGRGFTIRDDDEVRIVVTAPAVRRFTVEGASDLWIHGFDQPDLSLEISGSGDIQAEGRTRALTLVGSGSGDADLESLSTPEAKVSLSGSGGARVSPEQNADLTISGSGNINLTTRPASLRQTVTGSGEVRQD